MSPTKRRRRRASGWIDLLHLLWMLPLLAVPFGGFFMLLQGQPWKAFPGFWIASMIFGAPIAIGNWAVGRFLEPQLEKRFPDDPRVTWWRAGAYMVVSLLGSVVAIVILGYTLIPEFHTHLRSVVISLTFCAIFAGLFLGANMAIQSYRVALSRAGADRELQLARRIQRSFLLSEFPQRPRLEVHAANLSSKEVSGDFYDVVPTPDDGILLAVADVSGKGVPAALLSSMLQASLRTQAAGATSTARVMSTINALACQRDTTGQFATFFLAAVHEPTMTLRFTNAGHNFPVLLHADGSRRLLETGGLLVGMLPDTPYEEEAIVLAEGDRVVLYTDGVTEAANAEGEMFGEERLYALLAAAPLRDTAEQLVGRVLDGVREFLGDTEAGDDITVMALRVRPATAGPAA